MANATRDYWTDVLSKHRAEIRSLKRTIFWLWCVIFVMVAISIFRLRGNIYGCTPSQTWPG